MTQVSPLLSSSTSLFSVPPSIMEKFCQIMDCCDGELGWRGLAERLLLDWMEFRKVERYAEEGKSRTRELLWSWAQKNKTVGDLLQALQDMGHERAIHLFMKQGIVFPAPHCQSSLSGGLGDDNAKDTGNKTSDNKVAIPVPQHTEINVSQSITFQNIAEGTKDFHTDLKIREGQFFDVYKAKFQNKTYAVKLFKQETNAGSKKQTKQFLSELEVFLLFHHPNILELVGYFSENGKMCLIHPYMKNGSLLDRIQCSDNSIPLSWQTRLNILIGTARAIQYLHAAKPCSVLCGSLTSANILLDDHFQPKLSDFAVARLRSHLVSKSYTITMDSDTMKSLGYFPEEYIRQGKLSIKTDVYSYGIVVMEMLTGYKPVMEDPRHILLRDLLLESIENGGVDSLIALLDKKAGVCPHSVSHRLFTLAVTCAASREKVRPSVEEVLENLESAQHVFYFDEDLPKSLKVAPPSTPHPPPPPPVSKHHFMGIPVENDESQDFLCGPCKEFTAEEGPGIKTPRECSQSEVTFLGSARCGVGSAPELSARGPHSVQDVPPISPLCSNGVPHGHTDASELDSRPCPNKLVQCSCSSGAYGSDCEDCIANGFGRAQKANGRVF